MPNEPVQARSGLYVPAATLGLLQGGAYDVAGAPHRRSGTRAITGPTRVRLGT